jgi:glutamine synthetase
VGLELEFFLQEGEIQRSKFTPGQHAYQTNTLLKVERFFEELSKVMTQLHIEDFCFHSEGSPNQFELSIEASDPYTSAVRFTLCKLEIQKIADRLGFSVEMSPKPVLGHFGNGLHINLSLHGLKPEVSHNFMYGVAKWAPDFQAVYNRSDESYLRLFDQDLKRNWLEFDQYVSKEKRSGVIRNVSRDDRYEFRLPDMSANIFSSLSACICCGLRGVRESIGQPIGFDLDLLARDLTTSRQRISELDHSKFGISKIQVFGMASMLSDAAVLANCRE